MAIHRSDAACARFLGASLISISIGVLTQPAFGVMAFGCWILWAVYWAKKI